MTTDALTRWATDHPLTATATGAAALAVLTAAVVVLTARTTRKKATGQPPAAVIAAAVAAVACTAYSADTSWRFAANSLDMASTAERAAMFAAAELALFSTALMARQNLRTLGTPGTPGILVWAITGVQIIPAYAESGIVGGTVRAVVGPILAAVLWHLAMGIELRHAKPGAGSDSLPALLFREARERLLSRLGLATRAQSAEQITRHRWTVKAVALAARLADMPAKDRRRARTGRRLSVAVGRALVGADEEQRQMLLDLLAARRHATALATIDLASPWERPATVAPPSGATKAPAAAQAAAATERPAVAPPAATPVASRPATSQPATPSAATEQHTTADASDGSNPYPPGTPHHIVHALWTRLGQRPTGPAIVEALGAADLPNSPQQARKVRAKVATEHPNLPGPRAA